MSHGSSRKLLAHFTWINDFISLVQQQFSFRKRQKSETLRFEDISDSVARLPDLLLPTYSDPENNLFPWINLSMEIPYVQQSYFNVGDDGRRQRVPALRHRPAEEQPLPHLGGQHGTLLAYPVNSRFTLTFLGICLKFCFCSHGFIFCFFIPPRVQGHGSFDRVLLTAVARYINIMVRRRQSCFWQVNLGGQLVGIELF